MIDPALDLVLDRYVDVPPQLVWAAWTQPEHLKHWFCPRPWMVAECELDLRPGGRFYTLMRGPDGTEFGGTGCFLELVPNERIVWTSALGENWRPNDVPPQAPTFTAIVSLKAEGSGTRYHVVAMHKNAADRDAHNAMGFEGGWSTAADQLVEYMKARA